MNTQFVMGNFQLVVDARADEVGYVEAIPFQLFAQ
jgi:hypothetical protein